jgi:hypothetical protein
LPEHQRRQHDAGRHAQGAAPGLVVAEQPAAAERRAEVERALERWQQVPAQDGRVQERRAEHREEQAQRAHGGPQAMR